MHLNYTDVANNNNKYYIMQLLQRYDGTYEVYSRYGRVGAGGQTTSKQYANFHQGKIAYEKQFKSKTRGGYTVLKMN